MRAGLLIALAVFVACKNTAPPAPEPVPPTPKDAEAFGIKVAAAIQACDTAQLSVMLDVDAMLDRVIAGRRIGDEAERGLRRGFKSTFGGKSLCSIGGAGKKVHSRWLHNAAGSGNPVLRLISDDGINYLELVLDSAGGQVRIVDVYPYTLGEMMSHSFAAMLDTADSGPATKLNTLKTYMANNQPKQALATIKELPPEWQQSKMVMVIELGAAAQAGDDAVYLATIEKFGRTFPGDPALDLIEIDGAFMRKEFKKELDILDRLDKHVGGDPYLDVMRANAYGGLGDLPKAVAASKRAAQKVPDLEDVWWQLAAYQTEAGDNAGAVQSLGQLRDRFKANVYQPALQADPRFGKLVATKEYKDWMASSPAKSFHD